MVKQLFLVLVILVILSPVALLVLSNRTQMAFDPPLRFVGAVTTVQVRVENPHGLRRVTAWFEQAGVRQQIFETTSSPARFTFLRKHEGRQVITFNVGKQNVPNLKDGKGRVIVEAQSNDLRGAVDSIAADIDVITRPPTVGADGAQHYINQGGAELVTFVIQGLWSEAGVRVGKHDFRSFPMPGKPDNSGERFSLFAFPWDTPAETVPVVYARNPAGTEVRARFWYKLFPKKFRSRDFELNDAFLEKAVDQIDPGGSGDLLQRFLKINGEMRVQNNQALADLRNKTEQRFLWSTPFLQLSNSKVESQFADTRTYVYKGKKVDLQTHLGFDLSVVQHTPVEAANDGKVVYADNLGIYGNCVVIDHGYGLQSIYGHLSLIGVKPGDMVKKAQEIGKSGSTGLAGGDHLHFSMQVDGVQVTPVEWWDGHWIQDRIFSKVPPPASAK